MLNEKDTKTVKTPISQAINYEEIGEFWDKHDSAENWDQSETVKFKVNLLDKNERVIYYGIDEDVFQKIMVVAEKRGISADELLNCWIQEKLTESKAFS